MKKISINQLVEMFKKEGDEKVLQDLIKRTDKIYEKHIGDFLKDNSVERDELKEQLFEATFLKAIDQYDKERGNLAFYTFLNQKVFQRSLYYKERYMKKNSFIEKYPTVLNTLEINFNYRNSEEFIIERMDISSTVNRIFELTRSLSKREKFVIKNFYYNQKTNEEIGKALNLRSAERPRQIRKKAIRKFICYSSRDSKVKAYKSEYLR